MAKNLKDLTRVGTDSRKIAALLQSKAPKGHMLAFINPREAALLKSAGGSGHIDPETGIPSFEEVLPDVGYQAEDTFMGPPETAAGAVDTFPIAEPPPVFGAQLPAAGAEPTMTAEQFGYAPDLFGGAPAAAPAAPAMPFGGPSITTAATPEEIRRFEDIGAPAPAAAPAAAGAPGRLTEGQRLAAALGTTALGGLLGMRQARRAGTAMQAGAQQMRELAAPYQQQGAQLQAAAQRGELTPQAMQSLQAAQAQLRQGIEARGGVGVQQATQQLENLRQQLLGQQFQLGLQISGIGDQIALGAIRSGMQADQQYSQLYGSFIQNMTRAATGALFPQQIAPRQ